MFALCHPITPPAFQCYRGVPISGNLGTGRHLAHGIVVGSILLLAAVANLLLLPYPI